MTQEDKQLLLNDLCSRLPHGVNVKTTGDNESYTLLSIHPNKDIAVIGLQFDNVFATSKIKIDEVKPYIRPMSSMTEEERKEYELLANHCIITSIGFIHLEAAPLIDWLNAHHFDYRGLIPKGLAIGIKGEKSPLNLEEEDNEE